MIVLCSLLVPVSWSAIIFLLFVAVLLIIAIVLILYFEKLCCFARFRFLKPLLRRFNKRPARAPKPADNPSDNPSSISQIDENKKASTPTQDYLWIAAHREDIKAFEPISSFVPTDSGEHSSLCKTHTFSFSLAVLVLSLSSLINLHIRNVLISIFPVVTCLFLLPACLCFRLNYQLGMFLPVTSCLTMPADNHRRDACCWYRSRRSNLSTILSLAVSSFNTRIITRRSTLEPMPLLLTSCSIQASILSCVLRCSPELFLSLPAPFDSNATCEFCSVTAHSNVLD